ncbi:cell division protein FtsL [Rhodospira trueperi]|uniref:Cell division protein FtsL n=1 Tax=Rhodospira trueperi TaxID=69960 RepID=A0A1G6YYC3_9PROT|nr:hypothetical protein [Rhodospira trueperi]SDD95370.1 hypothetical protein SAMN05421720_102176 [Rhodospira trueperi]
MMALLTRGGGAVLWAVLALAVATGLFLLKYEVQALETELAEIQRTNERHREAIHVLRADWSYMNQPGRLEGLVTRHLDLVPVVPGRVATLDALPYRRDETAKTRDGAPSAQPPRVMNPGDADAFPVPGRKPTVMAEMGVR